MQKNKINSRIIVKGELKLLSPLLIGNGLNETADIEVLTDKKNNAIIPGTSIAGAIKEKLTNLNTKLFGGINNSNTHFFKSSITFHDATSTNSIITVRDNVKINYETRNSEDKFKYNYEIVETGASFSFYCEIDNRESANYENEIMQIINLLENGIITFGAKRTSGLGRCKLVKTSIYKFDYTKKSDVVAWFSRNWKNNIISKQESKIVNTNVFTITLDFSIISSILIKSYNSFENSPLNLDKKPDTYHLQSRSKPIISGTSLKGVIRHRAYKIINTLEMDNEIINEIFGYVKKTSARRGYITVHETILKNTKSKLQHRIKIDRFTGGTIQGALLDEIPEWNLSKETNGQIKIELEMIDRWEIYAGLLLLVLKDLWNEDLPIGSESSIGRGFLRGHKAVISWDNHKIIIVQNTNGLSFSGSDNAIENLNALVAKLVEER